MVRMATPALYSQPATKSSSERETGKISGGCSSSRVGFARLALMGKVMTQLSQTQMADYREHEAWDMR